MLMIMIMLMIMVIMIMMIMIMIMIIIMTIIKGIKGIKGIKRRIPTNYIYTHKRPRGQPAFMTTLALTLLTNRT